MRQGTDRRRTSKILACGVAVALTTAIVGCATQAQMAAYQIQQNLLAGVKISEDCWAKFRTLPVYGRLNQDFIVEVNDPDSARKLAITRRMSSEQAADILNAVKIMQTCEAPAMQLIAAAAPSLASYAKRDTEFYQGIRQAVANRLPIGETNKFAQDHRKRTEVLAQQVGQELGNQLVQAHNSEIAQQQQAAAVAATAAALLLAYKQVPVHDQMFASAATGARQFESTDLEDQIQQMRMKREARQAQSDMEQMKRDAEQMKRDAEQMQSQQARMKQDAQQAQFDMQRMKSEQQRLQQELQQTRRW